MFDDLHDPNPPTAGMDALASVATRARQIRRRRSLALGGAGVAVVALAVAAFVLPGRDRARVAPADSVSTSSPFGEGPVPQCGALTDPVWMPNGELPGTPETISGIDPFTGDRVDGRVWSSPEGYGLLVQLPATSEVLQLPSSGQMWDLRVRDARPAVDSVEVTIWRRAGNCAARYLVPGDVEAATAWGASFVDQLTAAASGIGPLTDDQGVCPVILDERVACIATTSIQSGAMLGPVDATFVHLEPGDSADSSVIRQGLGVLHVVVGAGDTLSPLSRLAFESPIEGTELKSVVDLVPPSDLWCGSVRRSDGSLMLFELSVSSQGEVDAVGQSTTGAVCAEPPEGAPPSTAASASAPPTTAVVPTTNGPSTPPTPDRPVVAIDGNGDAVVFDENAEPRVLFEGTDPDDPLPVEGPVTYIDGVAVTADRSTAIVGVCCEPSAGALVDVDPSTSAWEFLTYGHLPALTSYGNLVWYAFGPVNIGGLDGSIATTLLDLDPNQWTVLDLAVVQRGTEPEEVLVLAAGPDGTYLRRVFSAGGDMQLTAKVSDAAGVDGAELSLAGWREDAFYVLDGANDRMLAFDAEDLRPTSSDVRTSEGEVVRWLSAWLTPTLPRHVEENGELWVGDSSWGGDYRWVR